MISAPLLALLLATGPGAALERIGLARAVERALKDNPAMRIAESDAARALALVEQARAPSLPTLALNAGYTRLDDDRIASDRVVLPKNQLAANFRLEAPLVAPQRWANWSRAEAAAKSVVASAADVRRQVAQSAARTWLNVLGQTRVVEASERAVAVADAHLAWSKERREGGLGNKLEEVRASQELGVARTQLAAAQGLLARLQEALGVVVGAEVALDVDGSEPLALLPTAEAALEGATTRRLDVAAARERQKAAQVATEYDWTDYAPLIGAIVQPAWQQSATLTQPVWSWQAQLVLTLPLYDGGLRYGQQKERRALLAGADAGLESSLRQAKSEVRASFVQVQKADEALAAARESAKDALSALEFAKESLRAGAATSLDVVDSERRSRDAETQVALAEDAARQSRLDLLLASGKFPP